MLPKSRLPALNFSSKKVKIEKIEKERKDDIRSTLANHGVFLPEDTTLSDLENKLKDLRYSWAKDKATRVALETWLSFAKCAEYMYIHPGGFSKKGYETLLHREFYDILYDLKLIVIQVTSHSDIDGVTEKISSETLDKAKKIGTVTTIYDFLDVFEIEV